MFQVSVGVAAEPGARRALAILMLLLLACQASAAPLAPDDASIAPNLVSWHRNASANFSEGTWTATKGPNLETVGDAGDLDEYLPPVFAEWTPAEGFFLGLENVPGVQFSADESDLLRAMEVNGGEPFDELTLIGVYQTTGNTDRTRPVGIGSRTEEEAVVGDAFNLSADASLRYDNGNNQTDPLIHLPDLTFRAGVLSDGLVWDYLDGELITEEAVPGGSFAGETRNDDLYVGDVRGGVLDSFAGTDPHDIFVAEVLVYNAPLSETQILGIGEWLVANLGSAAGGTLGDFDGNGTLDAGDIDLLRQEVQSGANQAAFDLNGDAIVSVDDVLVLVEEAMQTFIGDANLDGEFSSSDFVTVFTAGQYQDALQGNSTWSTGDWNADGDFDSGDFVFAFSRGGYEQGPRGSTRAVPEPASCLSVFMVACWALALNRR